MISWLITERAQILDWKQSFDEENLRVDNQSHISPVILTRQQNTWPTHITIHHLHHTGCELFQCISFKTNEMRKRKMNEMRPSSLHNPWFFVPISNSQCIAFVRTVVLENKRIRKTPITEFDLVSLFKEHFRLVKVSAEHEMRLSNGKQLGSIAIYPN